LVLIVLVQKLHRVYGTRRFTTLQKTPQNWILCYTTQVRTPHIHTAALEITTLPAHVINL